MRNLPPVFFAADLQRSPGRQLLKSALISMIPLLLSELLNQRLQQKITLVCPPGGNYGSELEAVAAEMNMRVVLWNVAPKDWEKNKTHKDIIANIKKHIEPDPVILLYEGKSEALKALPILRSPPRWLRVCHGL